MNNFKSFKQNLFKINKNNFENYALQLFNFQAKNNPIYKEYINYLNVKVSAVDRLFKIPFLPIDFFKHQTVKTAEWDTVAVFESSGTTGQIRSKHFIEDLDYYYQVSEKIFNQFYGKVSDYHIMALLPSYLERENSSLVGMVQQFIKKGNSPHSGFYLYNLQELVEKLTAVRHKNEPVILIGVSFALLDLAEQFNLNLKNVVVMETGGMKGRRKELTREELHSILKRQFKVDQIHSEYGMTELLSQAYAKRGGRFESPAWMKIMIRDINDPFDMSRQYIAGGVNVIDLANVQSCAFIETQDIGRKWERDYFEILGRFDNADIRGCNLLTL